MSLIIHAVIPEGIIVASDRRTVSYSGDDPDMIVNYADTSTAKTVAFPNNIVISFCGGATQNGINTENFLIAFRQKCGKNCTVEDIPLKLLQACKNDRGNLYLISGYTERGYGVTYEVDTQKKTITLCVREGTYGITARGCPRVADKMIEGVDPTMMGNVGAAAFLKACIKATSTMYKYHTSPSVGGNIDIYIIDYYHDAVGFVLKDTFQIMCIVDEDYEFDNLLGGSYPDEYEDYVSEEDKAKTKSPPKKRAKRKRT